jgi:hypothetical protein
LTTRKMTDPVEEPCLLEPSREGIMSRHFMNGAAWHQTTPALKLILCNRSYTSCNAESPDSVFFAIVQQKHLDGSPQVYALPVAFLPLPYRFVRKSSVYRYA